MSTLKRLESVGPATLRDFARLGIRTSEQLASAQPEDLYARLCELDGRRHDPCVLDLLRCAVAQARDPELPRERRRWAWWSKMRKRKAVWRPR